MKWALSFLPSTIIKSNNFSFSITFSYYQTMFIIFRRMTKPNQASNAHLSSSQTFLAYLQCVLNSDSMLCTKTCAFFYIFHDSWYRILPCFNESSICERFNLHKVAYEMFGKKIFILHVQPDQRQVCHDHAQSVD